MDQELKKLIKKNLELTKENQAISRYIKKVIIFQQVLSVIKVLIIVIPITLGILYLPSWLQNNLDKTLEIFLGNNSQLQRIICDEAENNPIDNN